MDLSDLDFKTQEAIFNEVAAKMSDGWIKRRAENLQDVADKIGMPYSTLSSRLSRKSPKAGFFLLLAHVLGVESIDEEMEILLAEAIKDRAGA